jgi:hypothetical protein
MAEFRRSKQIPTPEAFIDAATVAAGRLQSDTALPWEGKDPTKPKSFNLRIDEQTLAKLHWLADYTPGCRSVQSWVKRVLDEAIEKSIQDLLNRHEKPMER